MYNKQNQTFIFILSSISAKKLVNAQNIIKNYTTRLHDERLHFTFGHLADAFIQSDLMRTTEAIKTNRAMICKCYSYLVSLT